MNSCPEQPSHWGAMFDLARRCIPRTVSNRLEKAANLRANLEPPFPQALKLMGSLPAQRECRRPRVPLGHRGQRAGSPLRMALPPTLRSPCIWFHFPSPALTHASLTPSLFLAWTPGPRSLPGLCSPRPDSKCDRHSALVTVAPDLCLPGPPPRWPLAAPGDGCHDREVLHLAIRPPSTGRPATAQPPRGPGLSLQSSPHPRRPGGPHRGGLEFQNITRTFSRFEQKTLCPGATKVTSRKAGSCQHETTAIGQRLRSVGSPDLDLFLQEPEVLYEEPFTVSGCWRLARSWEAGGGVGLAQASVSQQPPLPASTQRPHPRGSSAAPSAGASSLTRKAHGCVGAEKAGVGGTPWKDLGSPAAPTFPGHHQKPACPRGPCLQCSHVGREPKP